MVKENSNKPEQKRVYDVDGFKKRAACVCVKNENENEVLLISSSRNNNNWIVPGGGIEDNENPEEAAAREVYEEAGVKGRLGRYLGIFESVDRKHRTSVYILIVDKEFEDWEEHIMNGRKRKWFNLNEARQELEKHKPVQGTYLSYLKGYETSKNSSLNNYFSNHTNSTTENNCDRNTIVNSTGDTKSVELQNSDGNNNSNNTSINNGYHNSKSSHQYSFINYHHHHIATASPTYSYSTTHSPTHLEHDRF